MNNIIEYFSTSFFGGFIVGVLVITFMIKIIYETVLKLTDDDDDSIASEWLHCFQCEIEMPVKKSSNGYRYCSNCGLIHK